MRYILPLLLVFITAMVSAQDNALLKVIAHSDGPSINGEPVRVGMYVNNPDYMINIPKGGYVGVITDKGEVFKLTSSIKVGTVGPATVHLKDLNNNSIAQWTAKNNYAAIPIKWDANKTFALEIEGPVAPPPSNRKRALTTLHSYQFLLTPGKETEQLKFDLARLEGTTDRLLMESVIYRLNNFFNDSNWDIYKTMKNETSTTDPVLSVYYHRMLEEFKLDAL